LATVNFAQTPRPATSYRSEDRASSPSSPRHPQCPVSGDPGWRNPAGVLSASGARNAHAEPTQNNAPGPRNGRQTTSLGLILIIILVIFLIGGFSGRFGGYGYGLGHSGMGLGGVILIVLLILVLLGKL